MALIKVQRRDAKRTVGNLIRTHEQTLRDIAEGKQFFKDGENITQALAQRIEFEIEQCRMVFEAIDSMSEGNIKRAAELCLQIQEHILNVH